MSRLRARSHAPEGVKAAGRAIVSTYGWATAAVRMPPDFLIVGTQRGGTTSLFRTLAKHPDVVAPLLHKGVHFFDTADHYARGFTWYQGHFPVRQIANRRAKNGHAITGEASPYYMFHPLAPERIARHLPEAKLVVLLRDPTERAFSSHKQETARGFETVSFAEALELEDSRLAGEDERIRADPSYQSFAHQHHAYRRRGLYAHQLVGLFEAVGRDRVLVVDTDDLFAPGSGDWPRLLHHLTLASWTPNALPRDNARPSRALDPALRDELDAYFTPHDDELMRLLGRDLAWRR